MQIKFLILPIPSHPNMISNYISLPNSTIHYRQFGSGDQLLFCFHGYGRDSYTFYFLEKNLGTQFTIIAIDLPFHGLTQWKAMTMFEPSQLVGIINEICTRLNKTQQKYSLLGYSMGGRMSLKITQLVPDKIERLVLVAPDGFSINFWHWFCTFTWPGNKLLAYIIEHPGIVKRAVSLAERTRVISSGVAGFVRYYMHDQEQRRLLYQRWTIFRHFILRPAKLKKLIKKYNLPVRLLFGEHDKIIPASGGRQFIRNIENHCQISVIDESHYLLREQHAATIARLFND